MIIECVYDDHTSYFELDDSHAKQLLGVSDANTANDIITTNGNSTGISSDLDVDVVLVCGFGFDKAEFHESIREAMDQ